MIAALGLLLSCSGGEGAGEVASIDFAKNPLMIEAEAGVYDCGLVCTASWTASTKDPWVTVLRSEGKSGDALQIRVSANTSDADRNAAVTVKAGSTGKVLQLVQYGDSGSGFVSSTHIALDTYGTATYITVNTEGGWTFTESSAPWLTLEKKGAVAVGISADVNFTGQPRSSRFTVSSSDGKHNAVVTVTQQFSNEKFLASTEYGRRLVYAMGSYIKSVTQDSYKELTDGVVSFEMSCSLKDGLGGDTGPLKRNFYLFQVDMTKAGIVATLPDDDDSKMADRQEMSLQLPALQSSRPDLTVWGGTNGDFFHGNQNNELQGILYRRGVCLQGTFETAVNTFFAVFKDGTAKAMAQTEYNAVKENIQEAVGGRQHILIGGTTVNFIDGAQHPRTAVGTSADGKTTWILVVDGREEQHKTGSYSVSYEPLARILKAAGATDAINLDGGGSSTYVVREADGSFSRRNQPGNAGRTERAVVDGLAVVTY